MTDPHQSTDYLEQTVSSLCQYYVKPTAIYNSVYSGKLWTGPTPTQ